MRGEKMSAGDLEAIHKGSPPRARGKVEHQIARIAVPGITPACAGKSDAGYCTADGDGDHPRVRGEKFTCSSSARNCAGSPPRARGKVAISLLSRVSGGITPACAGKRLKHIPYLLLSCAKHLFTLQFCVDDLCQLAVGYSAVSLNIR